MREMRQDERDRAELVRAGGTVTAHMKRDAALITWATAQGLAARIDRRTRWGNPYPIDIANGITRGDVIDAYRQHLFAHPELLDSVAELRGKVLVCWCYPEPCHGDVLIDALRSVRSALLGRATTAQDAR